MSHASLFYPLRDPASAETCLEPRREPRDPSVPGPPARTFWPVAVRNYAWSASTSASEWAPWPTGVTPLRKSPLNSAAGLLPVITSATPSVTVTATSASNSSRCMAKCKQVGRPSQKRPQTASESGAALQTPECHRRLSPRTVASSGFERRRQEKLFIVTWP